MPSADTAPVAEGEVLAGKYRVEKILGRGGMGVVVAATHVTLRQKVAIKFLLPGATPEVVERFLREARAAVRLKSDHVARVIDVGELASSAPYMVMEYLDGKDLSQLLRDKGALPIVEAVDYVLQACEAIAEAHVAGIVHRDLKPANLFLTLAVDGSPSIKVLDFGISKDSNVDASDEEMALTKTSAVLGSPSYMAPEQMKSTRSVDSRADIWSLGVILYQLVTKTVPFKAPSFMELIVKVVNEAPPPPSSHRKDLPPGLEAAILRCLTRDRDARYATVAELAAAIAPFGGPEAIRSADRTARTQGLPPPSSARPIETTPPPPSSSAVPAVSHDDGGTIALLTKPKRRPLDSMPASKPTPTLESAAAASDSDAGLRSQSSASSEASIAPPSVGPRSSTSSQGKTADAWTAGDPIPLRLSRPERPNSRFLLLGGGAVGGGIVIVLALALFARAPREAPTAGPTPSIDVAREASAADAAAPEGQAVRVAPASAAAPTPPADSASSTDSAHAPNETPPTSPKRGEPHRAGRPSRTPVVAEPSPKAQPEVVAPVAAPPAPTPAPRPAPTQAKKKSPLDIDIQ